MGYTETTNLKLKKPITGTSADDWGSYIESNLDVIDSMYDYIVIGYPYDNGVGSFPYKYHSLEIVTYSDNIVFKP
jgi:hypothetical protein